jgi:thiamine biosynthesis protein ThiS
VISIHLNGEARTFEGPITVEELIRRIEIPSPSVAVAVNSEIVPRSEFDRRRLQTDDRVEIIRAVGGG